MENVVSVYKPLGLTPLQLIKAVQIKYPKLVGKKIAYAGRLDPMAEGVMVLLVEPETKNRSQYQNLDKAYEFSMILGVQTDTHDLLGEITNVSNKTAKSSDINRIIQLHKGTQAQSYPAYSSKTVKGKPLYWWARNDKLNTIIIPSKTIDITEILIVNEREISPVNLHNTIVQKIDHVTGDFRQERILEGWSEYLHKRTDSFSEITIRMSCSTGTYVRSLVDIIGRELGTYAVTSSIKRTRVGVFTSEDSLRIT